jgi:sugar-specific transcriptional regulator TrmB
MLSSIKSHLKELGFRPHETDVYIALTQMGEASASAVAKKVSLPRTTTISILNKLAEENYLSTYRHHGKTYYWVETPRIIQGVLKNKIAMAEKLEELLADLYRTEPKFPFAHVYDTKKSLHNFIEKLLEHLSPHDVIFTIDSPKMGNYQKVLGEDFQDILVHVKKKKSIVTHTLVPFQTFRTIHPEKLKAQSIVIRELPEGIHFQASIWFIGHQLVLFSGKPPFAVSVYHPVIVESLKSLFDYFWQNTKTLS